MTKEVRYVLLVTQIRGGKLWIGELSPGIADIFGVVRTLGPYKPDNRRGFRTGHRPSNSGFVIRHSFGDSGFGIVSDFGELDSTAFGSEARFD